MPTKNDFLNQILTLKRKEITELKAENDFLTKFVKDLDSDISDFELGKAILKQNYNLKDLPQPVFIQKNTSKKLQLIAEIKRKSPSKGLIRANFKVEKIAKEFVKNKVSAISILTDKEFFGGDLTYLKKVKEKFSIPILRKDFILAKTQILESKENQADLILLIMKILDDTKILELISFAIGLNLQVLIEFHNQIEIFRFEEILKALTKNIPIELLQKHLLFGINNRDLETFEVNFETCLDLKKKFPEGFLTVAESAIFEIEQLEILSQNNFDLVLIGEGLAKNEQLLKWFNR
jgi:indole-3-glycerol phosphate synthase